VNISIIVSYYIGFAMAWPFMQNSFCFCSLEVNNGGSRLANREVSALGRTVVGEELIGLQEVESGTSAKKRYSS
jgi:hypothetical protein